MVKSIVFILIAIDNREYPDKYINYFDCIQGKLLLFQDIIYVLAIGIIGNPFKINFLILFQKREDCHRICS